MATVLVADDEATIVELVRFTLEDDRVRVLEAADGHGALAVARAARPDLVLLDVRMPGIDGVEVCRRLRREPGLEHTRIVMLTAAAQAADRQRALRAGADDYLTKPFSPLALFAIVRALAPEALSWPET